MVASRLPEVIDAAVSVLRNADLTVWDGPVVTGDFADSIFIGFDGDPDGDFQTADVPQEWAGLGARHKNERGPIICAVVVLLGDDDVKTARDKAYAMASSADTALRADPSLGLPPPLVVRLTTGSLFTEPTEQGYQVRLLFQINIDIARV